MGPTSDSFCEMDEASHLTNRDIKRLLAGRIPVGDEDTELARFLSDFERAFPEPSVKHCEAAHLSAIHAAARQLAAADYPVTIRRGVKEVTMKRLGMSRLVWVTLIAVLVLGIGTTAAFAAPGVFSDGTDTTATDPTATTIGDVNEPTTDSTLPATTDTTAAPDTTDTTAAPDTTDTTATSEVTAVTGTHPDNFGGTISAMRHAGDHTPAAVVKGKIVPGFQKKMVTTTTTQATVPTP